MSKLSFAFAMIGLVLTFMMEPYKTAGVFCSGISLGIILAEIKSGLRDEDVSKKGS